MRSGLWRPAASKYKPAGAEGEGKQGDLQVDFDARLKLEFQGSRGTSDAGLLAFRELDDVLGLSELAGQTLVDSRTGHNARHSLLAQFRQSVFGRLPGYEDVNDDDRLSHDPAMRRVVGGRATANVAASASQMGRFETGVLARADNLAALADLSGRWIDVVRRSHPTNVVVLDIDSSVSRMFDQTGGLGLRWTLRLRLLSPALPVQPIRRPGAMRPASRQRGRRRRLALGPRTGDRTIP
jgi:hypothetical protein